MRILRARVSGPACAPLLLCLGLMLAACDSGGGGGDDDGDDDSSMPDAGSTPCTEEPCLDPPQNGFQIRSVGTMVEAGQDVEYCEIVQLPGTAADTYYVNGFDVAMTTGSHHLIVTAIHPGSATEAAAPVGARVPCTGPQVYGEEQDSMTGSQHPYYEERMPPGVGVVYKGGQHIVFDYHYFNAGDAPLQARAAINVHTVDEAEVEHIAQRFGFYNIDIPTPNGQQSSHTASCSFGEDVELFKLVRHTHQWATDFTVWWKGGPNDGEMVFTTPDYEETDHWFPTPVSVQAGTGFTFQCNFDNDSGHDLNFGLKASDEMCILFGIFYTADGTITNQDCLAQ